MAKKPNYNPAVVVFADNLLDVLPTDYTHNLALLPVEQRDAIVEDLRRWGLANEMFDKRRSAVGLTAIANANKSIKEGIAIMQPETYREDMRRRLNILKEKLK